MEKKIKNKKIKNKIKVTIGDDIPQLNQGLLNRLHLNKG